MSGVNIICRLLEECKPLADIVPPQNILAGVIPQTTALPAVSVMQVSSFSDMPLSRGAAHEGASEQATDRVQVTVLAKNYGQQKALIKIVRRACRDRICTVAGFTNVSTRLDGVGPDFNDAGAEFYMQTQDIRVGYTDYL